MPRFKNKTGGTNRRLLIVPFNADFNGAKENPDIKENTLLIKGTRICTSQSYKFKFQ